MCCVLLRASLLAAANPADSFLPQSPPSLSQHIAKQPLLPPLLSVVQQGRASAAHSRSSSRSQVELQKLAAAAAGHSRSSSRSQAEMQKAQSNANLASAAAAALDSEQQYAVNAATGIRQPRPRSIAVLAAQAPPPELAAYDRWVWARWLVSCAGCRALRGSGRCRQECCGGRYHGRMALVCSHRPHFHQLCCSELGASQLGVVLASQCSMKYSCPAGRPAINSCPAGPACLPQGRQPHPAGKPAIGHGASAEGAGHVTA